MKTILRRLWTSWKAVGRRIGDFQARVILTVCYFVVVPPFSALVRVTGDPLTLKPGTPRGWRLRPDQPGTALARATRQY